MKNLFLILGVSFLLAGCNGEKVKIELDHLAALKRSLMELVPQFTSSEAGQLKAQPFFDETVSLVAQLADQEKPTEMLSSLFSTMSVDDFCQKIVLPKEAWQQINAKCESSMGYLCGEEVRELPNIYQRLFGLASGELSNKFKIAPICKDWF